VPGEEVVALVLAVGAAVRVTGAGDDQQIEILVVFDQLIDDLVGRRRVHVLIHLADDQQHLALQPVGVFHVRRFGVMRPDRPSHPLLVPPDFVHAVVVTARGRHGHLVEVREEEQAAE